MTKQSKPHHHHFVPQTYLKYFGVKKQKKKRHIYLVTVFDTITRSAPRVTGVSAIAAETDYNRVQYSLKGKKVEDEYYWEHYYNYEIERTITPTFDKLITACTVSPEQTIILDKNIKQTLSKIICSQLLRTKKMREQLFEITKAVSLRHWKKLKDELPHSTFHSST